MPNKRTGEDYLEREKPKQKKPKKPKKGWGGSRGGQARPLNKQGWDDLKERIRANEEKKRKARRTLPGRI